MAKQITKELMADQPKLFQDEMKKMQDEMSKMKEELSKKVEDAISGKNDATKDNANREITLKEAFNLHQNAQAISLLVTSLGLDEFAKINRMESAKQVWDTLKVSFEGDKNVRKGNIDLLHGELERFVFLQGEMTQVMFDRLMALVNHIRALCRNEWDNNKVVRKMLRTYRAKNNMLASVIMERPGYDEMTPQELFSKLKHHEGLDEDAINAHNQNPSAMGYNKSAALKATQQHEVQGSSQEKKKVKDDFSSEEEDFDEEVAFVIRNLRKFMKKEQPQDYGDGKKRYKMRFCYGGGQTSHFIADCSNEKKKNKYNKDEDKKNKGKKER
ncbi:uncharacterized protein [Miscanthus floridulus]|uniref:uncharacterized protein n=1 Tax=Miscanthus floridulus TaxID=154761 RepID=UPI00345A1696